MSGQDAPMQHAAPVQAVSVDGPFIVLAVNPGSTSTKVAVYSDEQCLFEETTDHPKEAIRQHPTVMDQFVMRLAAVEEALARHGHAATRPHAVAGRGGLLAPMPGGTWRITEPMLAALREARHGEHPCNLGAPLALHLARKHGCEAYIVDPPVTDEMDDVARLTGLPEIRRRSVFHALSQRISARTAAAQLGISYEAGRFLVAHMGGGISVAAHRHGRIVDVVNALDGDGPFTPERTGRLPLLPVLDLLERGLQTFESIRRIILREGGVWAHCGTNDLREVERRMDAGDAKAAGVFDALVYAIAKELASLAPALLEPGGTSPAPLVSGIVLTGGMARSRRLTDALSQRLSWLAPVVVLPEVAEMRALVSGVLRVLRGEEVPRAYRSGW